MNSKTATGKSRTQCVLVVLGALGSCIFGPIAAAADEAAVTYRVSGDEIREPLAGTAGDALRGSEIARSREAGNCILCHTLPEAASRFAGDIGPGLAGAGQRLSAGQLRLRVIDAMRVNPQTIMPSYYRTEGLQRVAAPYRGKPVLSAQQVEDLVAYLSSLRN